MPMVTPTGLSWQLPVGRGGAGSQVGGVAPAGGGAGPLFSPDRMGGGAGGFGGASAGGYSAQNQAPQNVRPMGGSGGQGGGGIYGAQGQGLGGALSAQAGAGQGLLDPNSDYFKRLMEAMRGQIGDQTGAAQRAAVLRQAQAGGGIGQTGELQDIQSGIGRAGLQAAGDAAAGLTLQAPGLGGQLNQSTFGPALGLQQLSENQSQFGLNQAMQQQGMAQQGAQYQAGLQQQQQLANQQAQMQMYLAQLNSAMGGF